MVTQSLAPVLLLRSFLQSSLSYVSHLGLLHLVRFSTFIDVINAPLNSLVASPLSIIIIMELLAVLWFFGIHNAVLQGPLGAISMTMVVSEYCRLPTRTRIALSDSFSDLYGYVCCWLHGLCDLLYDPQQIGKMKQLGKLSFIPSIFNITEPIMFGMPIILNPLFFIPQVFTQLIAGFVTWGLATTILPISLNPTMSLLPWTTPTFIKMPFSGGLNYTILMIICMLIGIVMWYPFLKIADKKEYELELAAEKASK